VLSEADTLAHANEGGRQRSTHNICLLTSNVVLLSDSCEYNNVRIYWRKLRNEELHNLYSSPSIIRMIKSTRMRWAGHVARMRDRMLVRKPEGKRSPGRTIRRWVDNIKMHLT
jgi:hypothetical protein